MQLTHNTIISATSCRKLAISHFFYCLLLIMLVIVALLDKNTVLQVFCLHSFIMENYYANSRIYRY